MSKVCRVLAYAREVGGSRVRGSYGIAKLDFMYRSYHSVRGQKSETTKNGRFAQDF